MEQLDALGNPIIIGNLYGYSIRSKYDTHVIIGTVIKFTDTNRVTLKPTRKRVGFNIGGLVTEKKELPKSVSVQPLYLFPIIL